MRVEVAERNTRDGRVACVQADVRELPVRDASIDFAHSLGVLHHIEGTTHALRRITTSLRPSGLLLVYMYYKLDARSAWYRGLFALANLVRRASAPLPQPLLLGMTTAIAGLVYFPLARTARLLRRVGQPALADALPLSFYADLSFETMRNDSLDRFGSRLEKRYSRAEVLGLLEGAGLTDVHIADSHPYWHAVGRRARSD